MDSNGCTADYLYASELLDNLDFAKSVTSRANLSANLVLRPLRSDDIDHGFLELLTQLTRVGDVDHKTFKERFEQMRKCDSYYVTVIEDLNTSRVVCAATLFTELKFIHSAAIRGRIEEVVVDREYRGQRLGQLIIETLKLLAEKLNCYKLTLDCTDDMIQWYSKLGFVAEKGRANTLALRFTH